MNAQELEQAAALKAGVDRIDGLVAQFAAIGTNVIGDMPCKIGSIELSITPDAWPLVLTTALQLLSGQRAQAVAALEALGVDL